MRIKRTVLVLVLLILIVIPASAFETGNNYLYNQNGEAVPAPAGYVCEQVIYGLDLGIGSFNKPQDLYVDEKGYIYIADAGNNRIVVLKDDFSVDRIIKTVFVNGEKQPLINPQGLCVSNELLYICETGRGRVIAVDERDTVIRELNKPKTEVISGTSEFKPTKVSVNKTGTVYVAASGLYQGLLRYGSDNEFLGFFGANKVEVTPSVLIRTFWKNLFTDAQRNSFIRTIPTEYANVFIDSMGMIYTATSTVDSRQVRLLNAQGENILKYPGYDSSQLIQTGYNRDKFGEQEIDFRKGEPIKSRIVDVHIDKDGVISVLDNQWGRVFQYDKELNQICIFGGRGEQEGFFRNTTAVEKAGNCYLVADASKNSITVFEPMPYITMIRQALNAYDKGNYEQSADLCKKALSKNGGLIIAYRGIGRAKLQQGEYKQAMQYLKNGDDRYFYSLAVQRYRQEFVRSNIIWLFPIAVVTMIAFVLAIKRLKDAIILSAKKEGRDI